MSLTVRDISKSMVLRLWDMSKYEPGALITSRWRFKNKSKARTAFIGGGQNGVGIVGRHS